MNKLFQKASDAIKRLTDSNGMKNYTIKFKKIKRDEQVDCFGNSGWYETTNNSLYNAFFNHFDGDDDIIIKKIVAKDSSKVSYIKFKATTSGYKKIFSLFADENIATRLKIISAYKP